MSHTEHGTARHLILRHATLTADGRHARLATVGGLQIVPTALIESVVIHDDDSDDVVITIWTADEADPITTMIDVTLPKETDLVWRVDQ